MNTIDGLESALLRATRAGDEDAVVEIEEEIMREEELAMDPPED